MWGSGLRHDVVFNGERAAEARIQYMRRAPIIAAATLLAGLGLAPLFAQRYTYRQYDSVYGLTDMAVHCLMQDRTGFIWAGTDNGLFRYDGSHFRAFHADDGLPHPTVRAIAESPQGVVWVGTNDGVAKFIGNRFQKVEVGEPGHFLAIAFDSLGRLYVESPTGLIRGIADGAGSYRFQKVASGAIYGLFVDREDIWFVHDKDLWHLQGDREERVGSPNGLPEEPWKAVVQDANGNLWVSSESRLFERPHGKDRFQERTTGLPKTVYTALYSDARSRVYISSFAGVAVLDGDERTLIDAAHGLPAESIYSVLVDREGSLWLGAMGNGLIRQLGRGDWLSWKKEDGLLDNTIWAIHRDQAGQTWIGTNGGVNVIDPHGKVTRSWSSHDGLAYSEVHALIEGPNGDIYAATYPNGISRFGGAGKLVVNYRSSSVISAGWIQSLAYDRQGLLWAVGPNGCFRSRQPLGAGMLELDRVQIPGMAEGTQFFVVIADGDTVWAGSSHGLARLANGQWHIFTQKDGLKSDTVFVIARGRDALWISYEDSMGLSKLEIDGSQIKRTDFTSKNGLASDEVFGIVFDTAGRLWASSDAGIDLFDHGHRKHYGREDGLIWIDSDSLALEADHEGNVWVGTSAGLSRYSPPRLRHSDAPPPVVLTNIEGESRHWIPGDHPVLPFNQRSIFMQFAALNFADEDHIRFRYRLLGYETRWNETPERGVHFERLPAGHYLFQVIASGPNDVWTPQPAEFAFSVTPPWWQTWWFLLTCLGLCLLLLRALYRIRVHVLVEHKHRLERLVAERTAELTESQRRLEEIAYCDMLTQLPNRREFTRQLRARIALACRQNEKFALLLIDLDHFKAINDTYGHDAGDKVLIETAKRLRASVREYDCVARLGGDEFAIILFSTFDKASIQTICNRILSYSSVGIPFSGQTLMIGSSIGVALFPDDGQSEEGLYKASDLALYEAKRERSNYCFVPHVAVR